MTSTRHEPVYHATCSCQAASLAESSVRLRGFWACQVESQKKARFLARVERDQHDVEPLSRFACMLSLRLLKGGALIAAMMHPHGKDDPDPHIGQRTYRHPVSVDREHLHLAHSPAARSTEERSCDRGQRTEIVRIGFQGNTAKNLSASKGELVIADVVKTMHSIVISKREEKLAWENSEVGWKLEQPPAKRRTSRTIPTVSSPSPRTISI